MAWQELACGYMTGKLLLKLDATQYILQNHALEDFAFMEDPANSRNRSTFYFTLARLLFQDEASSKTKFKSFIAPLQQARQPMLCLAHSPGCIFCVAFLASLEGQSKAGGFVLGAPKLGLKALVYLA